MSERDDFDTDDDFADDDDEDVDKFIAAGGRRPKAGRKVPQAAWSRVEDVLAERRLQRELENEYDID